MAGTGRVVHGDPEPEVFDPHGPSYSELLLADLRHYGDEVAQICNATGQSTTFQEIYTKSIKLAIALQRLGMKKGDAVAISSENRFEFTICAIATIINGGTCATLNVLYSRNEIIHAMSISKPVIIFCSPITIYNIMDAMEDVPSIKHVVTFGDEKIEHSVLLYSDFFTQPVDVESFKPIRVDIMTHPVAILCSSGTTGLPKGVVLTHANFIICNSHLKYMHDEIESSDLCALGLIPWFHAYGFITHLATLRMRTKLVFMVRFEEEGFLSAFGKYKIKIAMMVPPILVFLAKHPLVDKYDMSSLKEIWCGAAPLSREVQLAVQERIGVPKIKQGYGLTETTLAVLHNGRRPDKYGSVGKVVPGTQAKVIDVTTGEILGPNKEGELCFKGPLMMLGYLGDTTSTIQIFDSEGWLHTGDVGYYDEDEYFYIVDRLKELIKFKGFQVPPAELEALLLQNDNVRDAAVIGIEDEAVGERPMAFIVKQPNSVVTEEEIIDFVAKRVSYPKRLHGGVRFIDEIPKNPSGKILRRELRDLMKRQKSKL